MSRMLVLSAALVPLLATSALADRVPPSRVLTRDAVAASCATLGAAARSWGLEQGSGAFGCQNMTTGQAITCKPDGTCTDYVGDPRWRRIRDVLDKYGKTPKLQRI